MKKQKHLKERSKRKNVFQTWIPHMVHRTSTRVNTRVASRAKGTSRSANSPEAWRVAIFATLNQTISGLNGLFSDLANSASFSEIASAVTEFVDCFWHISSCWSSDGVENGPWCRTGSWVTLSLTSVYSGPSLGSIEMATAGPHLSMIYAAELVLELGSRSIRHATQLWCWKLMNTHTLNRKPFICSCIKSEEGMGQGKSHLDVKIGRGRQNSGEITYVEWKTLQCKCPLPPKIVYFCVLCFSCFCE